jgi:hypothetical protein
MTLASPIPVPKIDTDEPVIVIPTASVAPLDGPPDGERINTFTLAPKARRRSLEDSTADAIGELRDRALRKPLTCMAAAFSLGYILARVLR